MRGLFTAILVFLLGIFAQPIGERCMKGAPDAVWRWISVAFFAAAVAVALLTEPFYGCVKGFRNNPFSSTAIISGCAAVLTAAVWLFLIVGFSSSEEGMGAGQAMAELTREVKELRDAISRNPSIDSDSRLSLLRQDYDKLEKQKNALTTDQKETLKDQELTLKSLEEGRKKHLESKELEKRQSELASRQQAIEREEKVKKVEKAREPEELDFEKKYSVIVDHAITVLYQMLSTISKASGEPISTDFPSEPPSVYRSKMFQQNKLIGGGHIMRVGRSNEWEFRLYLVGPPDPIYDQSVEPRFLSLTITAGPATVRILSFPSKESPRLRVQLQADPYVGYRRGLGMPPEYQYQEECALTDYQKPIGEVMKQLIQNRYIADQLGINSKPPL